MSLVDFYNELTEVDGQMKKEAEEMNKLAYEEEAAGRFVARGFLDELDKLARQAGPVREEAGPTWTKVLGEKYTDQGPRRGIAQKEMAARGRTYGPQQKYYKQEKQFQAAQKEEEATRRQKAEAAARKAAKEKAQAGQFQRAQREAESMQARKARGEAERRAIAKGALGRLGRISASESVRKAVKAHEAKRKSPAYEAKRQLGLMRGAAKETYGPTLKTVGKHGKMLGSAFKETYGPAMEAAGKRLGVGSIKVKAPSPKVISTQE